MYVFRAQDLVLGNTVDLPKGRLFFPLPTFFSCLLIPLMSINVEAGWALPFTWVCLLLHIKFMFRQSCWNFVDRYIPRIHNITAKFPILWLLKYFCSLLLSDYWTLYCRCIHWYLDSQVCIFTGCGCLWQSLSVTKRSLLDKSIAVFLTIVKKRNQS